MKWEDMRIRDKFILSFGVILFFIFLISLTGIVTIKLTEDNISSLEKVHYATEEILEQETAHLDWVDKLKTAIEEGDVAKMQGLELDPKRCSLGNWYYSGGRDLLLNISPTLPSLLPDFEKAHKDLHEAAAEIKELLSKGDKASLNEAQRVYRTKVKNSIVAVRDSLNKIKTVIKKNARETLLDVKDGLFKTKVFDAFIVTLFIVVVAFMSYKITRHLTVNMARAVNAAERIAEGDVSNLDIRVSHKDETGLLLQSMQRIVESINSVSKAAERVARGDLTVEIRPQSEQDTLGKAIALMTEGIRHQTRGIIEAANVLASSVSEIMTSASEIAASASETATSVSETTVTAEEVRQTAKLSAEKALNVSEITKAVVEASQATYASVDETIEKMNMIRIQMESIAESIVKLSEQGQAIGEIVDTVSDLAEQSNLLAVNASIEAARAGEYGRGFAVVAQEVRALAEQSKAATVQIRSILSDIQKATSKSVLVSEQGSKAVAEGIRQSTETGISIRNLAGKVSEAADAASQILASSQQQAAGMDQIVFAMENINQASVQNAENIKTFESVTRDLNETAQRLHSLISSYKV